MVYRNTVDSSPPDPSLEKTTNSRSPDIEEISEDIRQTQNIYHFQNCGTVCMSVDSFNARGVSMENCGNNIPQVTCSYSYLVLFHFSSNFAISYYLDHHPRIIGNENGIHSQSYAISNGMWALCAICHSIVDVEHILPPLGLQNATSPLTDPSEITKSNPSNVHQKNALPPPQSPQPDSPSHFTGDHNHHSNVKYLEQLLDSSLATVAVIQISGNTLADVLTPRAYDAFKALTALDAAASSTKPYSSNRLPPLLKSSLAVSRSGKIHISIAVDYVMLFPLAGLAAISFLVVFFNFPRLCERNATGLF